MKLTARNTHRDLAYFFLGLIIAFSFSGIFLNHRQQWHPIKYSYATTEFSVASISQDSVDQNYVNQIAKEQGIKENIRRFQVTNGVLRANFPNYEVEIELSTGTGKKTEYRTTPLLGQMTILHVNTSQWWIYYSDAFGVAMLVIAFTGMFIQKGNGSFRKRGWKLALIGIIFPLIFLFLLN